MDAQQALRNCLDAYLHLKREMCEVNHCPFDCIMLAEVHWPERIAVAPVERRENLGPIAAAAKAGGARWVLLACEAHVKEATLAEALASQSGDVRRAAEAGDLSVMEWIVVQGFDSDGLPMLPILTVDVGYDDDGQPTFGEVVERQHSQVGSGIEMLMREAMR